MRHSGLQRDVLALYRNLLRSAIKKDKAAGTVTGATVTGSITGGDIFLHVREEFRSRASSVGLKDFRSIEHMLRQGYKQKKTLDMPGFTGAFAKGG
ncbi:hypothetical protein B484DRAFT_443757 [Ochromonadaceae sp. CCMP2298]|nr:hypothetical protein B484DRAFT_443757 [Ochromonadaceae sp. CCMP2298]|mmetsp:Transcript_23600/g.52429  ORF Transcript_23600/g.52429 Transcript_23600/m.52429 type:complete len:96 (+) Transcript_23600:321-608(+)|eukprot:CAMPEP_0173243776 /NCGR_PEP_ID=MMETSP1142-20121109/15707_1 /TAXON_ID=483371 /ORGANISM="non described non described, Strain CCMP2298" /LENGTH=95 /DNA_ID=CAMNT_0014175441 /DNA_START=319 /DNA_END=606 /DNA_ORIENTATION=-